MVEPPRQLVAIRLPGLSFSADVLPVFRPVNVIKPPPDALASSVPTASGIENPPGLCHARGCAFGCYVTIRLYVKVPVSLSACVTPSSRVWVGGEIKARICRCLLCFKIISYLAGECY